MNFLATLFLSLVVSVSVFAAPVVLNSQAPDWSLQTPEGESIDYYQDSENKVSVVLFWATWCPYCATLMPHLEVIYRKYRNKGLKFYAISTFEDGEIDPASLFAAKKFSYTLLLNGDDVAEQYGVKGTPGLYVVDKDKKVIFKRQAGVSDILVKQNVDLKLKQALSR